MREFQSLLQNAFDCLLSQQLGRHLFVPLPIDYCLECNAASDNIELRMVFFNPEGEHVFAFNPRMVRIVGSPQQMDDLLPEFIRHAYHNIFRQRDDRLLREVQLSNLQATTLRGVNDLVDALNAYYAGTIRAEPYFSLRDLPAQEAHYALQFGFPADTDAVDMLEGRRNSHRIRPRSFNELPTFNDVISITDQQLNLYPNAEISAEVIRDRTNQVRSCIARILAGNDDPRLFTYRAQRYQALMQLENPAREFQVRRLLENSRYGGRRREVTYRETATQVQARARENQAAIQPMLRVIDENTRRLWGQELRRLHDNIMFGWDLAGEDETLTSAERAAAENRGMELLLENLTRDQREQYARTQSFYVTGGATGRIYEITRGKSQNVWVVDPRTFKKLQGLCFLPKGNLCIGDTMLTQKIALELEEKEALRVAIPFGPRNPLYDGTFPIN